MNIHSNRILCVEDDEDSSLMMKVLLGQWNYEVTLARTAADGFRLLQSESFDLCFLDTNLPDVSGLELCEHVCEFAEHVPIVFISGRAYESDKKRGLQAGAVAYLTKPLDFDLLKETMARLINETSRELSVAV